MPPAAPHDDGANPGEPQEASNTVRESLSVRERDFGMSPYSAPPTSWLEFIWKKYVSICFGQNTCYLGVATCKPSPLP